MRNIILIFIILFIPISASSSYDIASELTKFDKGIKYKRSIDSFVEKLSDNPDTLLQIQTKLLSKKEKLIEQGNKKQLLFSIINYLNYKIDTYLPTEERNIYYQNGEKQFEGMAAKGSGRLQGMFSAYHENGKKSFDAFYIAGKPYGEVTILDSNGQKIGFENYINGYLKYQVTYTVGISNYGQPYSSRINEVFLDDMGETKKIFYYSDEILEDFQHIILQDDYISTDVVYRTIFDRLYVYPLGDVYQEPKNLPISTLWYKDSKKHGVEEQYIYSDDLQTKKVISRVNYTDGLYDGKTETYSADGGYLKSVSEYQVGVLEYTIFYNSNGNILTQTWYNTDGKMSQHDYYEKGIKKYTIYYKDTGMETIYY